METQNQFQGQRNKKIKINTCFVKLSQASLETTIDNPDFSIQQLLCFKLLVDDTWFQIMCFYSSHLTCFVIFIYDIFMQTGNHLGT